MNTAYMICDLRYLANQDRRNAFEICKTLKEAQQKVGDNIIVKVEIIDNEIVSEEVVS